MRSNRSWWVFLLLIVTKFMLTFVTAQSNYFRNALSPINRNTRDIVDSNPYGTDDYIDTGISPFHYYQDEERLLSDPDQDYTHFDESEYQTYPSDYWSRNSNKDLGKVFINFLDENEVQEEPSTGMRKRMSSSFRERMENEKSKEEQEKLAEIFLKKLEMETEGRHADREYNNRDYVDMIQELWNKYKNYPSKGFREREPYVYMSDELKKRQIPTDYLNVGLAAGNYQKRLSYRDTYVPNSGLYFLKFPSDEDASESIRDDESNRLRYDWVKPDQDYKVKKSKNNRPYKEEFMNAKRKRYPVAKRSSNFYTPPVPVYTKRALNKEQYYKKINKVSTFGTDPKVAKDLSNIFGNKDSTKKNNTNNDIKVKISETHDNNKKISSVAVTSSPLTKSTISTMEKHHWKNNGKQVEKSNNMQLKFEPLKIKKKSIDWSNYFGIDRRKKKSDSSHLSENDIDEDWLMKRYNKIVALTVKRTSDYPLFHSHDNSISDSNDNNEILAKVNEELNSNDESKLSEIDVKLKNIEDLIIDEALKYTGAHEGDTDPKEIQQVKNKVISRLAAAYSLEKMRRALSEFKTSITTQKQELENREAKHKTEVTTTDGTRAAMKKKDAQLKRCLSKSDCDEQMETDYFNAANTDLQSEHYSTSTKNYISGSSDCEITEQRCRKVVTGEHRALYSLCKWHQTCYLCAEDGNEELLKSCDVMFVSKSNALCQDDVVCEWGARPALDYLRSMQRTAPLHFSDGCNRSVCDTTHLSIDDRRVAFKIKRR